MVADFHLENIKSTQEMLQVISLIGDLMADQLTLFHLGEGRLSSPITAGPLNFYQSKNNCILITSLLIFFGHSN